MAGKGSGRKGSGTSSGGGRRATRRRASGRGAMRPPGLGRIRLGMVLLVLVVVAVVAAGLGTAWLSGDIGPDGEMQGRKDGLTMAVTRPAPPAITGIPRLKPDSVGAAAHTDGGEGTGDVANDSAKDSAQNSAGGDAGDGDAIGDLIQQLERQQYGRRSESDVATAARGNPEAADRDDLAALSPAPEESWVDRPGPSGEAGFATIAIVIDDLGGSAAAFDRLMALPGPVTYAFLTAHGGTPAQADAATAAGMDVILHMPMEPLGDQNPGPNPLLVGNTGAENLRRLRWHLARLPQAVGINNHMGSRFTANAEGMRPILEEMKASRLFYLDSRTSGRSIGYRLAGDLPMPALQRDIFLDHDPDEASILRQLRRTEAIAAREGTAIAIGHPYPETLAVLERWMPEAQARGYVLVGLTHLLPGGLPGAEPTPSAARLSVPAHGATATRGAVPVAN